MHCLDNWLKSSAIFFTVFSELHDVNDTRELDERKSVKQAAADISGTKARRRTVLSFYPCNTHIGDLL